jgi:WD40 repeat protein
VWRVADGQEAPLGDIRNCRAHAFSSDSRRLVIGQNDFAICFDLLAGKETHRWRLPFPAHSIAFAPDNQRVAVGYLDANVASVYHVSSTALLAHLPLNQMSNHRVAWHPDGRRLAIGGADSRVHIWNLAPRFKVATLEGHQRNVESVTFHPAGELIATQSWEGVLRLWDAATGRRLLQTPLAAGVRPRFSRDGRWLAVEFRGKTATRLEAIPSREYRTLSITAPEGMKSINVGDFSPDGRFLAMGMDPGAHIWDVRSGRELATLPRMTVSVFFAGGRDDGHAEDNPPLSILTGGESGLERWPVSFDGPFGNRLRVGPPRRLSELQRAWFARGDAGGVLASVSDEARINRIVDVESGVVRRELGEHPWGDVRALSPDGRWAASPGWHSDRVRLWDAADGRMVHEWIVGNQTHAYFTPDSRALIICRSDEFRFHDVETRRLLKRLPREVAPFPGYVAFSADASLMALELAPAVICLKDAKSFRTIARLEDPHGDRATWMAFSPDGGQLAVAANQTSAVHLWDLRAIRLELAKMKLAWDQPDDTKRGAALRDVQPVTMEVVAAEETKSSEERAKEAIEFRRRMLLADPHSPQACCDLAWGYLIAPEALRDVPAALSLAEKAAQLAPTNSGYQFMLGMANYRAGRYAQAVEVLQKNLQRLDDRALAYDLLVLAMSQQRLGETGKAHDSFQRAALWIEAMRAGKNPELVALRAEAEALGIAASGGGGE